MVILFLVIGLIIGFIRKGKLRNLADLNIKFFPLIILAFLIQISIYVGYKMELSLIMNYDILLHFVSYILLFAGLMSNFDNKWFIIITLGVICNFMVIFLNGGKMPVSLSAASTIGITDGLDAILKVRGGTHQVLNSGAILPLLADIIPIPLPAPINIFSNIYSIGDFVVYMGTMGLLQSSMLNKIESDVVDDMDIEHENTSLNTKNNVQIKNEPYIDERYIDSGKLIQDVPAGTSAVDMNHEINDLVNSVPPYSQNNKEIQSKPFKEKENDFRGLMKKDRNLEEIKMESIEVKEPDDSVNQSYFHEEINNNVKDNYVANDIFQNSQTDISGEIGSNPNKSYSENSETASEDTIVNIWGDNDNNPYGKDNITGEAGYNENDINIDDMVYNDFNHNDNHKQMDAYGEIKEHDPKIADNNSITPSETLGAKLPNEDCEHGEESPFMHYTPRVEDETASDNLNKNNMDKTDSLDNMSSHYGQQETETGGIDTIHQFIIVDGKIVENPNYQKKGQFKKIEYEEEVPLHPDEINDNGINNIEEIAMNQMDVNDNYHDDEYKEEDVDCDDNTKHLLQKMSDEQRVDLMKKMKERKENGYNFVEIEVGGKKISFWKKDCQ